MFPYPSGRLHMGHVRIYTISDTIGHFQRMRGCVVGWDSGGHRAGKTLLCHTSGVGSVCLLSLECGLMFCQEVTTCLPDYYKWTQYLFIKLFEAGLAYQKEVRASSYLSVCSLIHYFVLQPLLDALADLPEWYEVKSMQANWIGDCSGCFFNHILKVLNASSMKYTYSVVCYTCSPEAVFGAAYVSVLPSHRLLHGSSALKTALLRALRPGRDSLTEVTALNVFTSREVPVVIFGKNEFDGHLDTVIGIPESSEEDAELARSLGLSWNSVLKTEEDGVQTLINSDEVNSPSRLNMRAEVNQNAGGYLTSTKLRDWLISRQRYWGTPIPIVHCSACGPVPVPVEELPVMLPKVPSLSGKGASPLKTAQDWLRCRPAERETDTMDTFVDSSWYYFRYTDPQNPLREPFRKLLVQGLIKGQTFRDIDFTCVCVCVCVRTYEVSTIHHRFVAFFKFIFYFLKYQFRHSTILKYNNTTVIPAVCFNVMLCLRWQARLWGFGHQTEGPETPNPSVLNKRERSEARKIWENKNYAITQVTGPFTDAFLFNAAISRLMGLTNTLSVSHQQSSRIMSSELWAGLSQVRNPLGSVLSGKGSVLQQPWPSVDPEYLQTPDTLQLSIRINNKACGSVSVPREVAQDAQKVQELVLNSPLGVRLLSEQVIKKAILSPRTALIYFLEDE
uniref:leucine--tRNA ligase n=1 Tax=Sinocyclocheilus rhinocerous TaxID=307959 RepID=A0A673N914_9TELE